MPESVNADEINVKGGVLIIGSLLWQDHKDNDKKDNLRKLWRERQLLREQRIMVKIPIRYGRLTTKDKIYSMVFSNSCARNKKGTCYFIPFRKTPISHFVDLLKEAREISIAEGMNGNFLARSKDDKVWCVLGILLNPTINKQIEGKLLRFWTKNIESQGDFDPQDFRMGYEKPCIYKNGKLNIDWPISLDKRNNEILNSYDFIIATATVPTGYPSIEELKKNVEVDKSRYYFIENYNSGITTFQDIEIINRI